MSTPDTRTMPTWALPVVQARHANLVKIAAKLGVEAPTLTVGPAYQGPVPAFFLSPREADAIELWGPSMHPTATLVDVTTTGATPVLPGGYQVLATVDHFPAAATKDGVEAVNLVACSPRGAERGLAAALLHAAPTCDHCGFDRNRARTIVVEAQDGTIQRVGSTCLRDFLGFHGASLDALWTLLREAGTDADADEYRVARGEAGDPILGVLTLACAAIREHGFVKTDAVYGYCTRDRVSDAASWSATDRERADVNVTEADVTNAQAILAWLLASTDASDYMVNLRTVATLGYVPKRRYLGLVVSAPQSWLRAQAKQAERQAREAAGPAGPAPIGRTTVEGQVITTKVTENAYGLAFKMMVLLDNGATVYGTIPSAILTGSHDALRGARVRFTATFEASDKVTHAWYSRPTKPALLAEAPTA